MTINDIPDNTTAAKIAVMQAYLRGEEIEFSLLFGFGRSWHSMEGISPSWDWHNVDYRVKPNPDPDAEWKAEMKQAYEDGECEVVEYPE